MVARCVLGTHSGAALARICRLPLHPSLELCWHRLRLRRCSSASTRKPNVGGEVARAQSGGSNRRLLPSRDTKTLLDELGLQSWLKTSGGKGLHVVVPLTGRHGYEVVKDFSRAAVQHLAATLPQRFTAKSGPANRKGKIFVDYLRNGHAQTTAAAFSARARPGIGVSMPIAWDALSELKSGANWTIRDAREYISFQRADPWASYWTIRQTLSATIRKLS